jgi:hypothetical protein
LGRFARRVAITAAFQLPDHLDNAAICGIDQNDIVAGINIAIAMKGRTPIARTARSSTYAGSVVLTAIRSFDNRLFSVFCDEVSILVRCAGVRKDLRRHLRDPYWAGKDRQVN